MAEEQVMICQRAADADFVARNSVYDRHCKFCNQRVAISGSSDRLLKQNPDIKICCSVCFAKAGQVPDEVRLTAPLEEVAADIRSAIPNPWKKRN